LKDELQFSQVLERELGIEGSLDLRLAGIPRLNDCKTPEEIAALHHKLVRFDCMIQDQYEEEFFVSYLKPKQTSAGSSQNSSEGSPNKGEAAVGPSN
jgi:hypothetical protein